MFSFGIFIRILNDREQSNWCVLMETFLSELTPPWLNLAQTMTGRCLLKSPFLPLVWRCRLQWPTYQEDPRSVVMVCHSVDVCTCMGDVLESTVVYARVLHDFRWSIIIMYTGNFPYVFVCFVHSWKKLMML